ncbi:MAG TPA: peptidylprolyl isomerase [Kofleriaceae bacterium]|jgi:peptidyl-prolyl cis-trans isomerase A (cyclophilin A)
MKTLALLVLLAACQKQADKADNMTPEPVAKQPSPDPSPAARAKENAEPAPVGSGSATAAPVAAAAAADDTVRPPVAADLATYVKKVPGSGSKLLAQFDTSMGTIHCELFGDKAPIAVANFVGLATGQKAWLDPSAGTTQHKPYFDGLTFHRVIAGFMIQGGDPLGAGTGGPGYNFDNEIDRSLKMEPGALAMANTGHPNSNGSQFFIMEGSKPGLVGGYTIFGQCSDPDVVKKITSVKTDGNDKPEQPVNITKVTITKG